MSCEGAHEQMPLRDNKMQRALLRFAKRKPHVRLERGATAVRCHHYDRCETGRTSPRLLYGPGQVA